MGTGSTGAGARDTVGHHVEHRRDDIGHRLGDLRHDIRDRRQDRRRGRGILRRRGRRCVRRHRILGGSGRGFTRGQRGSDFGAGSRVGAGSGSGSTDVDRCGHVLDRSGKQIGVRGRGLARPARRGRRTRRVRARGGDASRATRPAADGDRALRRGSVPRLPAACVVLYKRRRHSNSLASLPALSTEARHISRELARDERPLSEHRRIATRAARVACRPPAVAGRRRSRGAHVARAAATEAGLSTRSHSGYLAFHPEESGTISPLRFDVHRVRPPVWRTAVVDASPCTGCLPGTSGRSGSAADA